VYSYTNKTKGCSDFCSNKNKNEINKCPVALSEKARVKLTSKGTSSPSSLSLAEARVGA